MSATTTSSSSFSSTPSLSPRTTTSSTPTPSTKSSTISSTRSHPHTTSASDTSSVGGKSISAGAIVGGVIGRLALVCGTVVILFLLRRHPSSRRASLGHGSSAEVMQNVYSKRNGSRPYLGELGDTSVPAGMMNGAGSKHEPSELEDANPSTRQP